MKIPSAYDWIFGIMEYTVIIYCISNPCYSRFSGFRTLYVFGIFISLIPGLWDPEKIAQFFQNFVRILEENRSLNLKVNNCVQKLRFLTLMALGLENYLF